MHNIYSPDRFYITFTKDDSRNFNKNLIARKINIYAFIQIYGFLSSEKTFLWYFKKQFSKVNLLL